MSYNNGVIVRELFCVNKSRYLHYGLVLQEKKYSDKKRAKSNIELKQSSSKYPSNKSSRIPDILAHIEYKYKNYDEWINFYLDEKI